MDFVLCERKCNVTAYKMQQTRMYCQVYNAHNQRHCQTPTFCAVKQSESTETTVSAKRNRPVITSHKKENAKYR